MLCVGQAIRKSARLAEQRCHMQQEQHQADIKAAIRATVEKEEAQRKKRAGECSACVCWLLTKLSEPMFTMMRSILTATGSHMHVRAHICRTENMYSWHTVALYLSAVIFVYECFVTQQLCVCPCCCAAVMALCVHIAATILIDIVMYCHAKHENLVAMTSCFTVSATVISSLHIPSWTGM